ncbi:FAD-binding oxidoreductase [Thalassobius vesicularis]|uniref:FAD-binding oxidoreductase n=1 Tax=Thalassobius vesicularis TaxID=1294297 RepID=A0A4S3M9Q0_9RHOB|nr:FAD-binding oxidoreductase [Thalassobius vesicularis]THD72884.1 FAD-binding oxidoreductase [Thalassobius vesicularis]
MSRTHVAIVGAGIVGTATAIWAQRAGLDVTLIDRLGPAEGASFGNGGVLASCAVVPVPVPGLLRDAPAYLLNPERPLYLKWLYLPKLAPWLLRYLARANDRDARATAAALTPIIGDSLADHQALAQGTPAARYIEPCDFTYVYRDRAHFAQDAYTYALKRENGFSWTEYEGAALRDYDPALTGNLGFGAAFGGHGRITDPGAYVKALAAHLQAQGGRVIRADVTDVVRENGRVTGVMADGQMLACDAAVITTGAWSGPLSRRLGMAAPVESERGYHVELWNPSFMPRHPILVASGQFVATPMEGRLRLAGIVEFGGLKAPPSRAPFELLMRHALAAMPGLTWDEKTEWMGHRPVLPDSLPTIGEVPGAKGAFMGFGHHHVGLTGGPRTGRILAQLVAGQPPNLDLSPYAPNRFQKVR